MQQPKMSGAKDARPCTMKQHEMRSVDLHHDNFYQGKEPTLVDQNVKVIEFDLSHLGSDMEPDKLKKIANAKHVIKSETDVDQIKNTCKGTGKFAFRLTEHESEDKIRDNLSKAGIQVGKPRGNTQKQRTFDRCYNVSWKDSKLEFAEKRHTQNDFTDRHSSHLSNLKSNVNMGSNSFHELQNNHSMNMKGKAGFYNKDRGNKETEDRVMRTWDKMIVPTSKKSRASGAGEKGYMRMTKCLDLRKNMTMKGI